MTHIRFALLFSLLLLAVVACQGEDSTPPPPQPRTQEAPVNTLPPAQPIVVTATPRPSPQATLGPTLNPALLSYVGTWTLLVRFEITDSNLIADLDRMIYSASSPVVIGVDGTVTGSGQFSPSFQTANCATESLDTSALGFRVTGNLSNQTGATILNLTVTPVNPTAPEHYRVICADKLDSSRQETVEYRQPVLFPLFVTQKQVLTYSLDITNYSASQDFQLAMDTFGANYEGLLTAEVSFGK